ncbi:unnamed protein product [Polarella glacialis]|uniref:Uncharacterized protein n=1 Tax=Polarella glacialis TaxID=89957 RepID=A0A813JSL7_POLGL|nr:unnamed protein product [Polarella glacialis]
MARMTRRSTYKTSQAPSDAPVGRPFQAGTTFQEFQSDRRANRHQMPQLAARVLLQTCGYCRKAPDLTGICTPPQKSYCGAEEVFVGIQFNKQSLSFVCCRMQFPIGLRLTNVARAKKVFASLDGYYCPTKMDATGSAEYMQQGVPYLSDPAPNNGQSACRLVWDKFKGRWTLLFATGKVQDSVIDDHVNPTLMNTSGKGSLFSVTEIVDLTASYLLDSQPRELLPGEKPTYPELQTFSATAPDYQEYCDPAYLQNPSQYEGKLDEDNPCFHTFDADQNGLPRGITASSFWNCADRDKTRKYYSNVFEKNQKQMQQDQKRSQSTVDTVMTSPELAAGIAAMIPWGSYAEPGEKGVEETSKQTEKVAGEEIEKEAKGLTFRRCRNNVRSVRGNVQRSRGGSDNYGKEASRSLSYQDWCKERLAGRHFRRCRGEDLEDRSKRMEGSGSSISTPHESSWQQHGLHRDLEGTCSLAR